MSNYQSSAEVLRAYAAKLEENGKQEFAKKVTDFVSHAESLLTHSRSTPVQRDKEILFVAVVCDAILNTRINGVTPVINDTNVRLAVELHTLRVTQMVSRLSQLDEQVKKLMARDQIAAYVEYAREMIVDSNGFDNWQALLNQARYDRSDQRIINDPAKDFFQMDGRGWKTVSVDFYTESRNSEIHSITETTSVAIGLLAFLPAQFKNVRVQADFSKLIRVVAAHREVAAYSQCARNLVADLLATTYETNRAWDNTYSNWANVQRLCERKVIPSSRLVDVAKELFDLNEEEWLVVLQFCAPHNKQDSVRKYGVLEEADSAKQLVDVLPAWLRTGGRDQVYKKVIDAVSAKLAESASL